MTASNLRIRSGLISACSFLAVAAGCPGRAATAQGAADPFPSATTGEEIIIYGDRLTAGIQLGTTLVPLAALLTAMYWSLDYSYFLTLALAVPAAGFLVRTFILMHDCAHGSFLPSKRANEIVGFVTGVLTMTPFAQWRRDHALHHASSGDLDRSGHGDIVTLTIDEYLARNRWGRFRYRLYRNPLILFGFGPLYLLVS